MLNIYTQKNNNNIGAELSNGANGKETKVDAAKYYDPTGEFTSSQFQRSVWYASHRVLLYKILVWSLIAVSIFSVSYGLVGWGNYLLFGMKADSNIIRRLSRSVDYTVLHPVVDPRPIQMAESYALAGGVDKYDFVAEVANPNERHVASFDYYFEVDGTKTEIRRATLLAGENRPLVFFGYKGYPSSMALVLENVSWKLVSAHKIESPITWQSERSRFGVGDFVFSDRFSSDEAGAHAVKFSLKNNTAFSFAEPEFIVGLISNDSLVGVIPLKLTGFKSLETRKIDLRSYVDGLYISDVKIFPLIDIYDPEVYLAPEG